MPELLRQYPEGRLPRSRTSICCCAVLGLLLLEADSWAQARDRPAHCKDVPERSESLVSVESSKDLKALSCYREIVGGVYLIEVKGLTQINLPLLRTVYDGGIHIISNKVLQTVTLGALEQLGAAGESDGGNGLTVVGNPRLGKLTAPNLKIIGYRVVDGNGAPAGIVGTEIKLENNPRLTALDLSALQVTGNFIVDGCLALKKLSLPDLRETTRVAIVNNATLEELDLLSLESVRVDDILIGNNPKLRTLRMPSLRVVNRRGDGEYFQGRFDISDNAALCQSQVDEIWAQARAIGWPRKGTHLDGNRPDCPVGSPAGANREIRIIRDPRLPATPDPSSPDPGEGTYASAVVVLLDSAGKTLDRLPLERPRAELRPSNLNVSPAVWWLTVDYGVGAGSYNGPLTFLLSAAGDRLRLLEAVSEPGGRPARIALLDSPKTAWWRHDATTLLAVACRPDFAHSPPGAELKFTVTYTRYTWENGRWLRRERTEPGFWENENERSRPPRSRFP